MSGSGWLKRDKAEPCAKTLMDTVRRRVKKRSARGGLSTTNEAIATAVIQGNQSSAAILRDWFYASVGITDETDGSKETWYLTQSLVRGQFADINIIPWTGWIGDLYTRAKNALIDGSLPAELKYGPPHRQTTQPLGPLVEYLIHECELKRVDFFSSEQDTPASLLETLSLEGQETQPAFGLSSIIRTLDTDQNDQIRGPLSGIFILTGGPGVGKTTVALHRIPYLIDAHHDADVDIPQETPAVTESSTLVVVWKKHLVPYLDRCLNQLGLSSFPQENLSLLDDWVKLLLRAYVPFRPDAYRVSSEPPEIRKLKLQLDDLLFDEFLASKPDLHAAINAEFSHILDEVQALYRELASESAAIASLQFDNWDDLTHGVLSNRLATLRKVTEQTPRRSDLFDEALKKARSLETFRIPAKLIGTLRAFYSSDLAEQKLGADAAGQLRAAVAQQCNRRVISVVDSYFLLWAIDQEASQTTLKETWESLPRYAHVMIDEAQYYEPIVLRLLARLAQVPHGTMTIVGDLEQRISSDGGIANWDTVGLSLPIENINRLEVNYRWSEPVFDFLEAFRDETPIKEPLNRPRIWFSRDGLTPEVHTFGSIDDEADGVIRRLTHLKENGDSALWTVAVVVPDSYESHAKELIAPGLDECAIPARWASGPDVKDSVHQVVVTNFDSIVGLEFNAVFVLGVNDVLESKDSESLFAVWVAITRAKQFLHVSRVGGDPVFDSPCFERYRN